MPAPSAASGGTSPARALSAACGGTSPARVRGYKEGI